MQGFYLRPCCSGALSQVCLLHARRSCYTETACLTAGSGNSLQLFIWDADLSARDPEAAAIAA